MIIIYYYVMYYIADDIQIPAIVYVMKYSLCIVDNIIKKRTQNERIIYFIHFISVMITSNCMMLVLRNQDVTCPCCIR
jgi:hypothetical protein